MDLEKFNNLSKQVKLEKTCSKFYNQWLYKIDFEPYNRVNTTLHQFNLQKNLLNSINNILCNWTDQAQFKLLPGKLHYTNGHRLFTNDEELFVKVINELGDYIKKASAVLDNEIALIQQDNVIVVSRLPHDRYRYKVILKPHRLKNNSDERSRIMEWVEQQIPSIRITKDTQKWFINWHFNWGSRYILVDNESTLVALKLRAGETIGNVYEFKVPV